MIFRKFSGLRLVVYNIVPNQVDKNELANQFINSKGQESKYRVFTYEPHINIDVLIFISKLK